MEGSVEFVPVDDGNCFVCGPYNSHGLHLKFERDGDTGVRSRTQLNERFQGWKGIAHGGIALSLLDEAMAHAAGAAGYRGLTASLNARFRRPVPLEKPLEVSANVRWMRRNVMEIEARVCDASGTVLLEGEGRFIAHGRIER